MYAIGGIFLATGLVLAFSIFLWLLKDFESAKAVIFVASNVIAVILEVAGAMIIYYKFQLREYHNRLMKSIIK